MKRIYNITAVQWYAEMYVKISDATTKSEFNF